MAKYPLLIKFHQQSNFIQPQHAPNTTAGRLGVVQTLAATAPSADGREPLPSGKQVDVSDVRHEYMYINMHK